MRWDVDRCEQQLSHVGDGVKPGLEWLEFLAATVNPGGHRQ